MEPLITIETVPMQVEFVEKKPLNLSSTDTAQVSLSQDEGLQKIHPKFIRVDLKDSFEPNSTYDWNATTYTATAKYSEDGKLKLDIQMADGENKAIRFKQSNRGIDSVANFVSNEIGSETNADMQISFNLPKTKNLNIQFLPPDLELHITQHPKVIIKYVGGPIYVPLSADPDYSPLLGFQEFLESNGKGKLDQKI